MNEVILSELGIPVWRARPGVAFPGAPGMPETQAFSGEAALAMSLPPASAGGLPDALPTLDLCLYAQAVHPDEVELLEGILKAAQGLREGLRVGCRALEDRDVDARASLRLDGLALPGVAAMLADPSLKRPVWAAVKAAVAALG
ncbi:MAG: hypothetical protein ACOZAQ_03800 [Pseudomonadota bacterium]